MSLVGDLHLQRSSGRLLANFLPVLCSDPTILSLHFAQTKQSIFWGVGQKVAIVKETVYQILKGGGVKY